MESWGGGDRASPLVAEKHGGSQSAATSRCLSLPGGELSCGIRLLLLQSSKILRICRTGSRAPCCNALVVLLASCARPSISFSMSARSGAVVQASARARLTMRFRVVRRRQQCGHAQFSKKGLAAPTPPKHHAPFIFFQGGVGRDSAHCALQRACRIWLTRSLSHQAISCYGRLQGPRPVISIAPPLARIATVICGADGWAAEGNRMIGTHHLPPQSGRSRYRQRILEHAVQRASIREKDQSKDQLMSSGAGKLANGAAITVSLDEGAAGIMAAMGSPSSTARCARQ
jgi:hypothetical protein